MEAYLCLNPFPDVKQALSALSGTPLAILSNGNPKMLEKGVKNAGLDGALSHVISVDEVKTYKSNPAAYRLAAKKNGDEGSRNGLLSAHLFERSGPEGV